MVEGNIPVLPLKLTFNSMVLSIKFLAHILPSKNGLVERKHKHLIETIITMMSQASMPYTYWSYAVLIAVTLVNLLPTPVLQCLSPWFKLYSAKPDLSQLRALAVLVTLISESIILINLNLRLKSVYFQAILLHPRVICVLTLSLPLLTPPDMCGLMRPNSLLPKCLPLHMVLLPPSQTCLLHCGYPICSSFILPIFLLFLVLILLLPQLC